jgi:hypothetical protein
MKKTVQTLQIILIAAFFAFICHGFASGNMVIMLKDGRTMNVPVSKDDIVSLSFDETSGPASDGISWDFESGDLRGWTKTGDAFNTQPTYGDNPTARHRGQPSRHQGDYWIGGYENRHRPSDPAGRTQGDGPQGTLTSKTFTIRGPIISFLVGGGCDINTERVELIVNGQVVLRATGKCTETMERILWDVTPYSEQTAQIRLVDAASGGWGHINFDDVKFE